MSNTTDRPDSGDWSSEGDWAAAPSWTEDADAFGPGSAATSFEWSRTQPPAPKGPAPQAPVAPPAPRPVHGERPPAAAPAPAPTPTSSAKARSLRQGDPTGELPAVAPNGRRGKPKAADVPRRQRPLRDDDDDFPPPRRGRGFLAFLIVLGLLAGAALLGLRWYQAQVDPPGPPKEKIQLVIAQNTSTTRIGEILNEQGVIGNPTVFRFWVQAKGKGGFEAGKYEFLRNSSFESVLDTLLAGPSVPDEQKLTIPEGFRITQIGDRIGEKLEGRTAAAFKAVVESGQIRSAYEPTDSKNLEGFLFPETYTFGLDDDEGVIASRMVETFDSVADQVGLSSAKERVGVTPYEALVVASLVEREAKLDGDRAKIARVIYNRLKADMYLQIDAGIVYAMNNGTTRLFENDYKYDSPYNTYTNKGLPPAPIASPGKASLEAALNPEPGDWLYYVVTTPDGAHSFATSFKEHKRNIALAEKNGVR